MPGTPPVPATDPQQAYEGLDHAQRLLYERLSALPPAWLDADTVAAVAHIGSGAADWHLESLSEQGLLETCQPAPEQPSRYRLSPGASEHAARMLSRRGNAPAVRTDVVLGAAQWLLICAVRAQMRLTPAQAYLLQRRGAPPPTPRVPFGSDLAAVQWLASQQETFIGLLRELDGSAFESWRLVTAFWPWFQRGPRSAHGVWIEAHDIGLRSAVAAGDPQAARLMGITRAMGLRAGGHPDQALAALAEILSRADDHPDLRDTGQAHLETARCHLQAGRRPHAERHLSLAACQWERSRYMRGLALIHMTRGQAALTYGTSEETKDARVLLDAARTMLLECGTAYDAARALTLYGQACLADDNPGGAMHSAVKAASVFAQQGAPRWQARARELEGDARLCQDQPGAALTAYRIAAALYAQAGDGTDATRLNQTADDMTAPEDRTGPAQQDA
ncbi:hypothetical protein [Streptomyces acidiscabies]|uniref:Uncharacterized protein n=1 Tax=Streptomyces acidiscabies TaxID=42234 RepID=A0ABU4MAT4_9ACTN|nr:hypothetical protein [Streptomyces acidiscabies]MDX3024951.1 hypothetical protein [Streptomyces acidiscabies]